MGGSIAHVQDVEASAQGTLPAALEVVDGRWLGIDGWGTFRDACGAIGQVEIDFAEPEGPGCLTVIVVRPLGRGQFSVSFGIQVEGLVVVGHVELVVEQLHVGIANLDVGEIQTILESLITERCERCRYVDLPLCH